MEDFSAKIADLLQSEEAMGQLTALLSSLQGPGDNRGYDAPPRDPGPSAPPGGQDRSQAQQQTQGQHSQPQTPGPDLDLGALLGALGGQGQTGQSGQSGGGLDLGALLGMLGGGQQEAPGAGQSPQGGGDGPDPRMLGMLTRAMGSMKDSDQNIQLLRALRPYLEERRQGKVDEAIRMLRLLKLVPLLQESGIFPAGLG